MVDVKKYIEKKEKGLNSIAKIGDAYAISSKKFDPETGEALEPEVVSVSIKELTENKEELQKEILDIDTLKTDLEALDTQDV